MGRPSHGAGLEGGNTLTCALVTVPTLTFGFPEPLAMPAAFCSRTDAGGVLRMKVKLRSCITHAYMSALHRSLHLHGCIGASLSLVNEEENIQSFSHNFAPLGLLKP